MSTEKLNLLAPDPAKSHPRGPRETRLCDLPMEDIHDLEEYLFVSKFCLNYSYQSKHDPIHATNQFQAR